MNKYTSAIALSIFALCVTFTSCVQKTYYEAPPNNNYNNNTGSSYFDEEFNGSNSSAWNFADATDSAYASISGGYYQYVDYSTKAYSTTVVNTGVSTSGNLTISTSIKADNLFGLIFGASSTDNGYALYIDSAGYYSLYKESNDTSASLPIIPSTQDTLYAVKKGWNTLELDQTNGNWIGFINGTQIFQITARPISGSNFGFKIAPHTVASADYLRVKSY